MQSGVQRKDFVFTGKIYENDDSFILEPIDYCSNIIDEHILDLIVEESNKYSIQKNPAKPLAIDQKELEQFIGILYVTSLVKMPSTRLYWNSEFYFEKVAQIMTVTRLEFITSNLHCNDNLKYPPNYEDKLYKLRPLLDHFQERFSQIKPSDKLCIDEQMVPFKGKSHLKQYNPQKPKKWGYTFSLWEELIC